MIRVLFLAFKLSKLTYFDERLKKKSLWFFESDLSFSPLSRKDIDKVIEKKLIDEESYKNFLDEYLPLRKKYLLHLVLTLVLIFINILT